VNLPKLRLNIAGTDDFTLSSIGPEPGDEEQRGTCVADYAKLSMLTMQAKMKKVLLPTVNLFQPMQD
jgi:hypothetical protein